MNQIAMNLNQQLANLNVLYVKLQNYHWFVQGHEFFVLHEKFQHWYEELPPIIDELAERILTIGAQPIGTMRQFIEQASLQEANGNETAEQMMAQLERDYMKMAEEINQAIKHAEHENDAATADLLTGMASTFEKNVWMLRAYMAKAVQHV